MSEAMSRLFPIEYVYAGNILIFILLFIAIYQICLSPLSREETPGMRSKILTCLFILATYILNLLLIHHYLSPDDHDAVTRVRLLTCFTFCLGALTSFDFVTVSFDALYKSKKNEHKSPKWFIMLWKLSMTILVFAVLIGSFCAYYFENGQFFNLYYIIIDVCILIGGFAIVFAMIEIRARIKQIIIYQQQNSKKLKRKKFKFDMILISVSFGLLACIWSMYTSIRGINFSKTVSIYVSPYPTLPSYLVHLLFTLAMDSMLVLWIYKPCRCCKYYTKKSSNRDRDNAEPFDDLMVIHLCCPCLNGSADESFTQQLLLPPSIEKRMQNHVEQRRDNIDDANSSKTQNAENTITKMVQSKTKNVVLECHETMEAVIYNFENLFLSSPTMAEIAEQCAQNVHKRGSFDHLCEAFGGLNRVRLLAEHFECVSNKEDMQMICFSNCMQGKSMMDILKALNVAKCFDLIIGCDHEWFKKRNNGSLNEKLLKITAKLNATTPQRILYIDSNVNTCEVKRCQIMAVFGVNVLNNLTQTDIVKLQKFLS